MDTRLMDLLVCPICKGPLEHWRPPHQERQELVCHADKLAYPVRDGIPVMLESEARTIGNEPPPAPIFPMPPATGSASPQ